MCLGIPKLGIPDFHVTMSRKVVLNSKTVIAVATSYELLLKKPTTVRRGKKQTMDFLLNLNKHKRVKLNEQSLKTVFVHGIYV